MRCGARAAEGGELGITLRDLDRDARSAMAGLKLLIAGGGTGGHVFPALAVAREWMARGEGREAVIVGSERGIEMKLVPRAGLPLETIRVGPLKGIRGARLARGFALLLPALSDSLGILRRHRFAVALGVGGYASGPMMLAARLRSVPTVIFEPNVDPGFTNRVLAHVVTRIATAHAATAARLGGKARATGCPVRPEFFRTASRVHQAPFRLLITGGSQGARAINRAVVSSLDRFTERKQVIFVVHQTGEADYNAVRQAYEQRGLAAEVVPFLENMAEAFAQADLILCRAGAITVAEAAAAGRAAIFIPFEAATESHQLQNARMMAAAGAARLIREPELSPERLAGEIFSLLDDPVRLSQMEQAARRLARPDAARAIVDLLEEVARP
jgi:UDP-N-acetylglucosamine--N-acetylmuramyl-(pentapeptide) pyrophosphoryl-undecaprenol N-acetylglucosamine transferase